MIPPLPFVLPGSSTLYRVFAYAVLALALVAFGYVKGQHAEMEVRMALVGKQAAETVRIAQARTVVTERIVEKYLPAVVKIQTRTKTIIEKVPTYVSANDPPLPGGFRLLHDAAAAGAELPDPAGIPDAAPVSAQDAARVVAENYGICRADQERFRGLQEWVSEQGRVK